ncbi:MAG: helix-turn-helix transcriptional regulator [Clostridia bacterium]
MNGLKESREKAGLSQQALADMLHINQAQIARFELGNIGVFSNFVLRQIGQALNVSVDFLLNGKEFEKK